VGETELKLAVPLTVTAVRLFTGVPCALQTQFVDANWTSLPAERLGG